MFAIQGIVVSSSPEATSILMLFLISLHAVT